MNSLRLLIDFGSTFTKVVAVDLDTPEILARSQVPSTVEYDITVGLKEALKKIHVVTNLGDLEKRQVLACSSAAGGLRIVSIGFVPDYTARAAKQAALGAGAKVVGSFSYRLTQREFGEIEELRPDIIILAGGSDGGDEATIIHNAHMLSRSKLGGSNIIVAGNKVTYDEIRATLATQGRNVRFTKNVMPDIGTLDIEPCNKEIRELFIENIIEAKGIGKARMIVEDIIMPTPSAVLNAAKLLSEGTNKEEGLGELMIVDVGGATTDVHSIAKGNPNRSNTVLKGLPEPYIKRTVEGDLGVRYNMAMLIEYLASKGILPDGGFMQHMSQLSYIDWLPKSDEEFAYEKILAHIAVDIAVERHVGNIEIVYGPEGEMKIQKGKDLTEIKCIVGTGGIIAFSPQPRAILEGVLFKEIHPLVLKPKNPKFYVDGDYMLYAAGLLAESDPNTALRLMKKYLNKI